MPLYVLALTDTSVPSWTWRGRRFRSARLARGVHAVYETRDTAPPPADEELRLQHAAVVELAERVPAILPARFGSLVERTTLLEMIRERESEVVAALEEVRGRVQMTLRILGRRPRAVPSQPPPVSGRAYLEARKLAAGPPIPASARRFLDRLRPLAVRERREPGVGQLLATVYHLVNAPDVARYRRAASGHGALRIVLTGPWPPFAFTPRVF